jgi:hypothetical protein
MMRLLSLIALLLASNGCNNEAADRMQSGKVMGFFGLEGRWIGPVVPKVDGCGQTTEGLMTVGRGTFAFDPFAGTTVIDGTVSEKSGLTGTLSRSGNGQHAVSISFTGGASQSDHNEPMIEGQLESGRCSWTVSLKRG